jgi:hypothetical protein
MRPALRDRDDVINMPLTVHIDWLHTDSTLAVVALKHHARIDVFNERAQFECSPLCIMLPRKGASPLRMLAAPCRCSRYRTFAIPWLCPSCRVSTPCRFDICLTTKTTLGVSLLSILRPLRLTSRALGFQIEQSIRFHLRADFFSVLLVTRPHRRDRFITMLGVMSLAAGSPASEFLF